ncbi:MAG TPA: ribosome biogenesis GTPase Der [Anaeromyxobacter sp.]|nr:ribosome biogenesis GTPase Der [Anaeromyxobacter sp.]
MTPPAPPRRGVVALVGRPNVGKSTLFNRIAGARRAIVEDVPGVTRDRNYADVAWDGRSLSIVDTGGFEPDSRDRLMAQVRRQAQLAADEASAIVLVVDGREGLTEVDRSIADLLRRAGKPLFVAVNKVDDPRSEEEVPLAEFWSLGFGDVHALSAEHGRGVGDLLDAVVAKLGLAEAPPPAEEAEEPAEVGEEARPTGDVRLAVIGRPNVGKSTFVNALLGEERFVVSEVPGTTRDAIDTALEYRGRRFVVTDTAGIRRKRSIALKVEAYSVVRAMKAIDEAEVVACLVDATEAGVEQDARLLGLVVEKAKALVVVVNKWDVAEREGATQDWYREELLKRLPFVAFAPMVFVSAKERRGVTRVLDRAARLVEQYRARFPTPQLNELLEAIQLEHPAPLARGHPVKLFYVAQVAYAPPTFVVQCSRPEAIGDAYRRFVENRFREAFGLEVPMRLVFRERRRRSRPPPARPAKAGKPRGPRRSRPGRRDA